jgi:hypothetical protein
VIRVLLAGEGKTELGEWAKEPEYREHPGKKGVLVALLERAGAQAHTVLDGILWKKIRKYRAGEHAAPERRSVLGLVLRAKEQQCDAVVFCRDRDGDDNRRRDLDDGIRRARETFVDVCVIGGIAIEAIESWVLVLLGVRGEEFSSRAAKDELAKRGISTVDEMVDVVTAARLEDLPAGSLTEWFRTARSFPPFRGSHS